PHFNAGCVQRVRKLLATPIGRRREAVPASRGPGCIGIFPAGRCCDFAVLEWRTEFVAYGIEWRDYIAGEAPGFLEHGIDGFLVKITVQAFGERGFEAGSVFEAEGNIGNGSAVAHGLLI